MSDHARALPSAPTSNQQLQEVEKRLQLVNRFNKVAGPPDMAVGRLQRAFVCGTMTSDDMVSTARLYQYVLSAVETPTQS